MIKYKLLHLLVWVVVSAFLTLLYIDFTVSFFPQWIATLLVTGFAAPACYFAAFRFTPRFLYQKRIGRFLAYVFTMIIANSVVTYILGILVYHLLTGQAMFRSTSYVLYIGIIIFWDNLMLITVSCAVKIIADRYNMEQLLLEAEKEKIRLAFLQEETKRKNQIAIEKAQEAERNRIAAELHDNLGSQLSYISSNMDFILDAPVQLTEEEKHGRLQQINETAKVTMADLRESIWVLKKNNVEMEELSDRLKWYAQNQVAQHPAMHLQVNEKKLHNNLHSSEALHVFRIFQEALNNAIKYADASQIILTITGDETDAYCISLADNGKGFDPLLSYPGHYGILHMRERAMQLGASLQIKSSLGKGTLIALSKKKENTANELLLNTGSGSNLQEA